MRPPKSDVAYVRALTLLTEFQKRQRKLAAELSEQRPTSQDEAISQMQRLQRESSRAKKQTPGERPVPSPSIVK